MNNEEFEAVFEEQVERCRSVLVSKAYEYASDKDRLHNFKKAAVFQGITEEQALWGFITKHLVSLSDMIQSEELYSTELWDEKLGDAMNYLFLLKAILVEKN